MSSSISGASAGSVYGVDVFAKSLNIGSKSILNITDDPTVNDTQTLITSVALNAAVNNLIQNIQQNVSNVLNGLDGQVVITQNLVDPGFALLANNPTLGWNDTGWTVSNNEATISTTTTFPVNNNLAVPPGRYPNTGVYLFSVTVSQISVATLSVVFNNTAIGTITTPGTYNFSITVNNTLTSTLTLVASGAADTIVLTNTSLYGINNNLYNFLTLVAEQFASQASNVQVQADITAAINAHLAATNPHHITTAMIGAAPLVHYHPQYALLSQLSDDVVLPNTIVKSPNAFIPQIVPGSNLIRNSTILLTKNLNHNSIIQYSPQSGYITTNVNGTTPLVLAIVYSESSPTEPYTLFDYNASMLPNITYQFNRPRMVSEVILYTLTNTSITSVTQATVTIGTTSVVVNITPGVAGTIVSGTAIFNDLIASEVSITVTSVNDTTQPSIALGFVVSFYDTDTQDLAIATDTVIALNYNNRITTISPAASGLPINTSSVIVDHEYLVSARTTDGVTLTTELLAICPNYGDLSVNYQYPLKDINSDTDPYYGSIVMTGVTQTTGSYHNIYTSENAITTNSSSISLTQTFNTALILDHINIYIPLTLAAGLNYPTNIALILNFPNNTTQTIPVTPNLFTCDPSNGYYITNVSLLSYGAISSFEIQLNTTAGNNCVLSYVEVGIPCLVYDPSQNIWSDGISRKIVGAFTKLLNGTYKIINQPVGTSCIIPVNDFTACVFYNYYTVDNPFKHTNIDVTTLTSFGVVTSDITVVSITNRTITILCTTAGVYFLNVRQLD